MLVVPKKRQMNEAKRALEMVKTMDGLDLIEMATVETFIREREEETVEERVRSAYCLILMSINSTMVISSTQYDTLGDQEWGRVLFVKHCPGIVATDMQCLGEYVS